MANIVTFGELEKGGPSRGTKRVASTDDVVNISLPMTREYISKVRKQYPFQSAADIYKIQGTSDKLHSRQDDPSAQLIPEFISLPSNPNDIDYTLLSADIVCKYWSLKKNMITHSGAVYHAVREYVKSTEAIADVFGGIAGYASVGIFAGGLLMRRAVHFRICSYANVAVREDIHTMVDISIGIRRYRCRHRSVRNKKGTQLRETTNEKVFGKPSQNGSDRPICCGL